MGIEDFIRLGDAPPALRFLLIGGYAVGAHGFTRTTLDVDFLVNRGDRDLWLKKIEGAGLKKIAETTTFIQFSQEVGDGLDLMIVSGETFEKLWSESKETEVLSTRC